LRGAHLRDRHRWTGGRQGVFLVRKAFSELQTVEGWRAEGATV